MSGAERTKDIAGLALSAAGTVAASYDIARLAIDSGVPGDFVECGVFAGAQAFAMARAILDSDVYRTRKRNGLATRHRVHLFDSFVGIPAAGPEDKEFLDQGHEPGLSRCSVDELLGYADQFGIPRELLVIHEGFFEQTLPFFNETIAVLRLDGDLYSSTRECLVQLYPQLSPGGWLIVDDIALSGCRQALLECVSLPPAYFKKV
jgi:hypothetical protein